MKFSTIVGVLIIMTLGSCAQRTSINESPNENASTKQVKFNSGLKIENGINRGTNYTDSLGTLYSIRNIPITIMNDTTFPIQVQISFSKEYNYPQAVSSEKFKLIPLPKEWAADHSEITERMLNIVPKYIEKPLINEIIEPGEEFILSIGSVYPRPAKIHGVLPRTLFVQNEITNFPECEWLVKKDRRLNKQIPLGLKIVIGEQCLIIPCGSISYLKN
jgi:hypothetical protein